MASRAQCLCAHLKRIGVRDGAARFEDVASRDSGPEQADWACAHGIYDRAWQAGSRPKPSVCFGPRPGNCPDFTPGPEPVHPGLGPRRANANGEAAE